MKYLTVLFALFFGLQLNAQTKNNSDYPLSNITFKLNKADINETFQKQLDEVYKLLIANPNKRINLSGHACILGPDAFNKYLSKQRAKEVMQYLVNKGIPRDRILVRGYGSSQPLGDNDTFEGRAMNRRVEMQLLD
jgi:outer membrane protein OmpA-like peptidoglycan-associated protein